MMKCKNEILPWCSLKRGKVHLYLSSRPCKAPPTGKKGIKLLVMCGYSRRKLPILYSVAIWILANQERKEKNNRRNFIHQGRGGAKKSYRNLGMTDLLWIEMLPLLTSVFPHCFYKTQKSIFTQLPKNVWLCHRILWSRWRWHEQLNIGETSNWELKMCFKISPWLFLTDHVCFVVVELILAGGKAPVDRNALKATDARSWGVLSQKDEPTVITNLAGRVLNVHWSF